MSAFHAAAVAVAFLGFSCASLPPTVLSRRVLFTEYDKARPRVSPDGKRLAYLARDGGRTFLWIRSLEKDDARKIPLYWSNLAGISSFFWQGDSKHLLYLSDDKGDERFHVRRLDIETAETVDVTPFAGATCGLVAMNPEHPDELLVEANARDARFFDLYRVELKSGRIRLIARNPGDVASWVADGSLRLRAAIFKRKGGGTRIRLIQNEGEEGSEPEGWPRGLGIAHFFGMSKDGKKLWFSSDWESDTLRLLEWEIGGSALKVIASDALFDVESALVSAGRTHVESASFNRETREWQAVTSWMKEQLAALEPQVGKDFTIESRDSRDETWIIRRSADVQPPTFFRYSTRARKLEPLFEEYPEIPLDKLRPMRPIHFRARDGMLLYGYLTEPSAPSVSPPPLVVYVHGGPWTRDSWGFNPEVQWLASRGYAVLQINYRGSSGFGNKYEARGAREWGRKMLHDLLDGKEWAMANRYAAPGKVGIFGGSYGGYAALTALTMSPDTFACGVAVNGPTDLETFLKTAPAYWKTSESFLYSNIGNPETDREFLKERSPLTHAAALTKPLLVIQSANDSRVIRAQSDMLVKKLRELGKPVSYLVLPEGGHTIQSARYGSFLASVEEFLGKCLGGYAESPFWWERWSDLEQ